VSVTALDPVAHTESLYAATAGPANERPWLYLFDGPFAKRAEFDAYLTRIAQSEDPLYYAILGSATGQAVGHAAYLRIEPAHRCIEVGAILYAPSLQRTPGATEAMYLMAKHVFEDLGYRRYEWKCNALNAPSWRAALRFGFTYEGVFRQHMIVKGRNRDTAWFSMLDSEWPARKAAFERWLDPANFDADGRQKTSLSALNGVGPEQQERI
jgi:RimJ/RimL family protein N-acetyltransferase